MSFPDISQTAQVANDNEQLELRQTLAALDAQRALIEHARSMEIELRMQEHELRDETARWAVEERGHIAEMLGELDDIVGDGWYALSHDDIDRLVDWVER